MASGDGLGLFFNVKQIPCGPPTAPPPEVGPPPPSTYLAIGTTSTIANQASPLVGVAPASLGAGKILIALVHIGSPNGSDCDLPDDEGGTPLLGPDGWIKSRFDDATGGAHGKMRTWLWFKICTSSEPSSYDWTWDSSALSSLYLYGHFRVCQVSISGPISNSDGVDTATFGHGTAPPVSIPAVTPAFGGELILGMACLNTGSGAVVDVPSGWVEGIASALRDQSSDIFYKFGGAAGVPIGPLSVNIEQSDTISGYMVAMLPG